MSGAAPLPALRVRLALCLAAAGLMFALVSMDARAQAPGYDNFDGSRLRGAAPSTDGGEGTIGGDRGSSVDPAEARGGRYTSCTRRGRKRICKTFQGRTLIKVCTQRKRRFGGFGRRTCRATGAGLRIAAAGRAPEANVAAAVNGQGLTNPPMPGVVRFYNNNDGWCSGALLLRGIVLTAAHCLYGNLTDRLPGGVQGYLSPAQLQVTPGNYVDVSGRARAPYGNWTVADAFVPQGWADNDGGLDWGIVVLNPDASGNYAGDYTGTYVAQWNVRIGNGARFFKVGYPYSGPFKTSRWWFGHGQYYCDNRWDGEHSNDWAYTWSSYNLRIGPCLMNGGSSGGPVFVLLNDGNWHIVGVNNRGQPRADGYGSEGISFYFDERFGNFWNSVMARLNGTARAGALRSPSESLRGAASFSR